MYHEFFFGPFNSEEDASDALKKLDKHDSMWDYDGISIIYGQSPLPESVFDFISINEDVKEKINGRRRKNLDA